MLSRKDEEYIATISKPMGAYSCFALYFNDSWNCTRCTSHDRCKSKYYKKLAYDRELRDRKAKEIIMLSIRRVKDLTSKIGCDLNSCPECILKRLLE